MRDYVRPVATAVSIACLAVTIAAASGNAALAQAKMAPAKQMAPAAAPAQQPATKQIALTDKQVDGMIAGDKDIYPILQKMPQSGKPDPKMVASLDAAAKKNGFASYDEYNNVSENISMVFSGIDPATKKYVGNDAVTKAQIAQIQADKKMTPKDKKEALDDLNESLKTPAPAIENKGNIDIVTKYYDKLVPILGSDK